MTLTKSQAAQRLRRLEVEILPPSPVPTAILHQPSPDAPAAEQKAFERDLAAARQDRAKIWVVTGAPVTEADPVADVIYVQHDWQALLGVLGLQPGALLDLRACLSGNIVRPSSASAAPDLEGGEDDEPLVLSAVLYEEQSQEPGATRWRRRFEA